MSAKAMAAAPDMCDEPRGAPHGVPMELERQDHSIAALHSAVSDLSERLINVLQPHGHDDAESVNKMPTREPLSGVAEQIHTNNDSIYRAVEVLRDLTERVEL